MGKCCSKTYEDDEDPSPPRRVQYTRSRFTRLSGQKVHPPVDKDIWTEDLLKLVKNYKKIMKSLAKDESFRQTAIEDKQKKGPLVLDEYSSTAAMFWSSEM